MDAVKATSASTVILMGIESRICVYQTARDLVKAGFTVHVIGDAIASRTLMNKQVAIDRMRDEGVIISSCEMAIMELQVAADGDAFKQILRIIK